MDIHQKTKSMIAKINRLNGSDYYHTKTEWDPISKKWGFYLCVSECLYGENTRHIKFGNLEARAVALELILRELPEEKPGEMRFRAGIPNHQNCRSMTAVYSA